VRRRALPAGWLGRVRQALADLARPPSPLSARLPSRSAQSTALNTSRLKILRAREQLLADLFETTRKGIKDLGEDEGKYEQLLVKLIVQVRCRPPPLLVSAYVRVPHRRTLDWSPKRAIKGLLLILSPAVAVIARSKDQAVASRAVTAAIDEYKAISGRSCEVTLSDETLADDCAGGVKLVGEGNRITVNNTIDERLGLLEDKMLPEIRADLFGLNEVRALRASATWLAQLDRLTSSTLGRSPARPQNRKFYN
jgi:vacuolar-type H+-ATPase subunit E/Vma4